MQATKSRGHDERTRAEGQASALDRLLALAHSFLPTRALSRFTGVLARSRRPWLKNRLNRFFAERYALDLSEAERPRPEDYPSFNALFTRRLQPGSRPLPEDPGSLVSPCDGTVSAVGYLDGESILQAKGVRYRLPTLLGGLPHGGLTDGAFITIYLSPRDYHRFHAPLALSLESERHIPGRLLTVAPSAVRGIGDLFLRNERLALRWQSDRGPVALVAVGALNVGSIETVWSGVSDAPPGSSHHYAPEEGPRLQRGDELGRFNLGSTLILLLPRKTTDWDPGLVPGTRLRMGQALERS